MLLGTCTTRMLLRDAMAAALFTMSSPPMQTRASILSLASAASVLSRLSGSRVTSRRDEPSSTPPVEVDARDLVDGQLVLLVGVALGEPVEAVVEADGHAAELDGLDGHGADDAVGPGRGAAAHHDADALDVHGAARGRARAEVVEALAEHARREVRRLGQAVDPGRVLEVLGLQADHVGAGHPEAFARRVHEPHPGLARRRIAQLVEGNRDQPPALDADHGPAAARRRGTGRRRSRGRGSTRRRRGWGRRSAARSPRSCP